MSHMPLDVFKKDMENLRKKIGNNHSICVWVTAPEAQRFEDFLPQEIVWYGSKNSYTSWDVRSRWVALDLKNLLTYRCSNILGQSGTIFSVPPTVPTSNLYYDLDSFIKECVSIMNNPILPI